MGKRAAQKKLSATKILIAIIILIFLIIVLFTSPALEIKTINFSGGERYSKEDILDKLNIDIGMNIFMARPIYSKKMLEKDTYIKYASIKLKYPSEINIEIKERKVRGYVPYRGTYLTYLYIDEDGRVLEENETYKQKLPLVEGLKFDGFKIGEILNVKNQKSFDIVVKTANMMIKYEQEYDSIGDIVKIDVSNPDDIHINIRDVDVMLGNSKDYDYKIRTMLTIMQTISEKYKGFLDITDTNKDPVFTLLT